MSLINVIKKQQELVFKQDYFDDVCQESVNAINDLHDIQIVYESNTDLEIVNENFFIDAIERIKTAFKNVLEKLRAFRKAVIKWFKDFFNAMFKKKNQAESDDTKKDSKTEDETKDSKTEDSNDTKKDKPEPDNAKFVYTGYTYKSSGRVISYVFDISHYCRNYLDTQTVDYWTEIVKKHTSGFKNGTEYTAYYKDFANKFNMKLEKEWFMTSDVTKMKESAIDMYKGEELEITNFSEGPSLADIKRFCSSNVCERDVDTIDKEMAKFEKSIENRVKELEDMKKNYAKRTAEFNIIKALLSNKSKAMSIGTTMLQTLINCVRDMTIQYTQTFKAYRFWHRQHPTINLESTNIAGYNMEVLKEAVNNMIF